MNFSLLDVWREEVLRCVTRVGIKLKRKTFLSRIDELAFNVHKYSRKESKRKKNERSVDVVWYSRFLRISYFRVLCLDLPSIMQSVPRFALDEPVPFEQSSSVYFDDEMKSLIYGFKNQFLLTGLIKVKNKVFFVTGEGDQEWFREDFRPSKNFLKKSFMKLEWIRILELFVFGFVTENLYPLLPGGGSFRTMFGYYDVNIVFKDFYYDMEEFMMVDLPSFRDLEGGHSRIIGFNFMLKGSATYDFCVRQCLTAEETGYESILLSCGLKSPLNLEDPVPLKDPVELSTCVGLGEAGIVFRSLGSLDGKKYLYYNTLHDVHQRQKWRFSLKYSGKMKISLRLVCVSSSLYCMDSLKIGDFYQLCSCGAGKGSGLERCERWYRCPKFHKDSCRPCKALSIFNELSYCNTYESVFALAEVRETDVDIDEGLLMALDERVRHHNYIMKNFLFLLLKELEIVVSDPCLTVVIKDSKFVSFSLTFKALEFSSRVIPMILSRIFSPVYSLVCGRYALDRMVEGIYRDTDRYVRC